MTAAVSVFARDGYDSGSLNDVAVAAGVSRPNLLYYYPSKSELLLAVLEARDADLNRTLHHFPDVNAYGSFTEYVEDLTHLLPVIYADRDLVALYHRLVAEVADGNHPARAWVLQRHERLRQTYTRMIRAGIDRGELRTELEPESLAVTLLGAIEGIESQWLIAPHVDWRAATQTLRSLVTLALLPGTHPPQ